VCGLRERERGHSCRTPLGRDPLNRIPLGRIALVKRDCRASTQVYKVAALGDTRLVK